MKPVSRSGSAVPAATVQSVAVKDGRGAGWKITKRGRACGACARQFADGNLVFSTLTFEDVPGQEVPALHRADRCGVCHQRRDRREAEIVWRTQHEEAPKKRKLDLLSLSEVLKQLLAAVDPRFSELRFLVALLLLRHRRLRVVRTRSQDDRDFLVMCFGRSRDTFDVEVVDLAKERMEALRAELTAIFEGGELFAIAPPESQAAPDGDHPPAWSVAPEGVATETGGPIDGSGEPGGSGEHGAAPESGLTEQLQTTETPAA